jgi:hypothetical protein
MVTKPSPFTRIELRHDDVVHTGRQLLELHAPRHLRAVIEHRHNLDGTVADRDLKRRCLAVVDVDARAR